MTEPSSPPGPDESSGAVDDLDLTPRDTGAPLRPRRRGGVALVVGLVVLGALAFVVYQGLTDASLYFRNVDDAVAQRSELGDRRFRLQGTVVSEEPAGDDAVVVFTVSHDDVDAEVHHLGDPPELFQTGIPVVLEGRWSSDGDWFESDRMLVKHTNEYEAENPDRIAYDDTTGGGEAGEGPDQPVDPAP